MPGIKRNASDEKACKRQKTEDPPAVEYVDLDIEADDELVDAVAKKVQDGDCMPLLDYESGVVWTSKALGMMSISTLVEKFKPIGPQLVKATAATQLSSVVSDLDTAMKKKASRKAKRANLPREQEMNDKLIQNQFAELDLLLRDFSLDSSGNMLIPLYPDFLSLLLGPFLECLCSLLRNDSLFDISTRPGLYHHIFAFMNTATRSESLVELLQQGDTSPITLLLNMAVQAQVFLRPSLDVDDSGQGEAVVATDAAMSIRDAADKVQNNIKNVVQDKTASPEQEYERRMSKMRLSMVDIKSGSSVYPHAYKDNIRESPSAPQGVVRRMKEISTLATSLPVNWSSGIFLRVDEERTDVMKALIIGPEGTPYENGCFQFDIYLPPTYPQVPPMVQFMSTSGGRIRMNPNLYANGKVCLSLLGTWSGPAWEPGRSTLLQVLLSIQGMILVRDPYYNEPGTDQGNEPMSDKCYTEHIKLFTCITGITEQLKSPDPVFKDIIYEHFRLKKSAVSKQLSSWLAPQHVYTSPPHNFNFPSGRYGIRGNKKEEPKEILKRTVLAVDSLERV